MFSAVTVYSNELAATVPFKIIRLIMFPSNDGRTSYVKPRPGNEFNTANADVRGICMFSVQS